LEIHAYINSETNLQNRPTSTPLSPGISHLVSGNKRYVFVTLWWEFPPQIVISRVCSKYHVIDMASHIPNIDLWANISVLTSSGLVGIPTRST